MKTSFQRWINYSKVCHCCRAQDFHHPCRFLSFFIYLFSFFLFFLLMLLCCSCRTAFSHFICVVPGHSYFFTLPSRRHFLYIFFCIVWWAFQLQATLDLDRISPLPFLLISIFFTSEKSSDEIHSLIFSPGSSRRLPFRYRVLPFFLVV